jgi:hypothetical protein
MPRNLLRQKVEMIFDQVHAHPVHQAVHRLPYILRMTLGVIGLIIGLIAFLTPIPGWILIMTISLILILGFKKTKTLILNLIHALRLHILYARWYTWWHNRKNKKLP